MENAKIFKFSQEIKTNSNVVIIETVLRINRLAVKCQQ